MSKFKKLMTTSGPDLIAVRAENKEKEIRELKAEIAEMEDLGACTTDTLVVAEKVNSAQWARERINNELKLNDLNIELEIINKLIKEYFGE